MAGYRAVAHGNGDLKTGDLDDLGAAELTEELPRLRGERTEVAALPFPHERVEDEDRFA